MLVYQRVVLSKPGEAVHNQAFDAAHIDQSNSLVKGYDHPICLYNPTLTMAHIPELASRKNTRILPPDLFPSEARMLPIHFSCEP